MDPVAPLDFTVDSSRPLPRIGDRRALMHCDTHDDARLLSCRFAARYGPLGGRSRASPVAIFLGGGGVRAEWQEWPKALARLKQTTATVAGSAGGPDRRPAAALSPRRSALRWRHLS